MHDILGLRVLVVEPDRTLALVLAEALAMAGAHVVGVCPNQAEADRMLRSTSLQAMLVGTHARHDLALVARWAQASRLPFLLTCDRPFATVAPRALCLPKPFCFRDLVEGLLGVTRDFAA